MGHLNYSKIGKRCYGSRGFKLNIKKFSVRSIRAKFIFMFNKVFCRRWRLFSYGNLVQSMRSMGRKRGNEKYGWRGKTVMKDVPYRNIKNDYRLSFARSSSFYSEAIEDCLDFIKRNSIQYDEKPALER